MLDVKVVQSPMSLAQVSYLNDSTSLHDPNEYRLVIVVFNAPLLVGQTLYFLLISFPNSCIVLP